MSFKSIFALIILMSFMLGSLLGFFSYISKSSDTQKLTEIANEKKIRQSDKPQTQKHEVLNYPAKYEIAPKKHVY